jgi:outer membrane protein assembly factor BamB
MGTQRALSARVPAGHLRQPHLPAGRRRSVDSHKQAHRPHLLGAFAGSATIIGHTVYFADLGNHHTYGLDTSTGRVSFEKNTGAFDPVISDGKDIYLTGYTSLYALAPR